MNMWWILLIFICKTVAHQSRSELTNDGGTFQVEVSMKNIGRMKYRDGEVIITQNQQKYTDVYFTPFPYLQPEETQCHENIFSDQIELSLQVELYTPQLIQAVEDYLHKHESTLCRNTTTSSSSICDISLLPMNAIRLVQKGLRSNNTRYKYTLDENWQSTNLLSRSMEFVMYVSNMTVCERLQTALTEKCRLPNFELQYSLHGQGTVQRQLEANSEHVASTTIYNEIRAQFPSAETVLLTEHDFKKLISESTDRITMPLRLQEGFESLKEPTGIEKLLERHLSHQQIQLDKANEKLWEHLYWNSELTRPDHLAKVLNSIIRKESNHSERFIYDRQAAKDAMKFDLTQYDISQNNMTRHNISELDQTPNDNDRFDLYQQNNNQVHLTYHDQQSLDQLDKQFNSHSRSSSSKTLQNNQDNFHDEFKHFDLFKSGADASDMTQIQLESSVIRNDVSNNQHENVSNVTHTDDHNLNVLGLGHNHLNETLIDEEQPHDIQINNHNVNQMKSNAHNLNATNVDKNNDKQHTWSRRDVQKFLHEFSKYVHLEGDIIRPRPIHASLIKLGKSSTNTKLFSSTVLVRMRPSIYTVPLRCKPSDNDPKLKLWLTDRVERIENILLNMTNYTEIKKLLNEMKDVQEEISVLKNTTGDIAEKYKEELNAAFNNITLQNDKLYVNLTNMMKQDINVASNNINVSDDNDHLNLTNIIQQRIDAQVAKLNTQINDTYSDAIKMMQQKNDAGLVTMNTQTNDIYSNITNVMKQQIDTQVAKLNAQINDMYGKITNITSQGFNGLYWNVSGTTVAGTGLRGNGLDELNYPISIYLDSSNNLYISDRANHRVIKYLYGASSGTAIAGAEVASTSLEALNNPAFLYIDSRENLYVADTFNQRVTRWANGVSRGTIVAGNGTYGPSLNQLFGPYGIWVDSKSNIFVAEPGNHRVTKWAPDASSGVVVAGITGSPGNTTDKLNGPYGLFYDEKNQDLYISNVFSSTIMKWHMGDSSGTVIAGVAGSSGASATQLNEPRGIILDQWKNLYVTDEENNRIQLFCNGSNRGITIAGTGTNGCHLSIPTDIKFDSQMNLYVCELGGHRITKFNRL